MPTIQSLLLFILGHLFFAGPQIAQQVVTIQQPATGGGGVNPSWHNSTGCTSGGASCGGSGNLAVTTGDLILACPVNNSTATVTTMSDSAGDTFTQVTGSPWGTVTRLACYTATSSTTTTTLDFTCTVSSSVNYMGCLFNSYTGATGTPSVDVAPAEAGNVATTSLVTGTTSTTTVAKELLVGVCAVTASSFPTITAGGSYNLRPIVGSGTTLAAFTEDLAVTSTGAYQATANASLSSTGPCTIIALK
jgi:hypothetical protein